MDHQRDSVWQSVVAHVNIGKKLMNDPVNFWVFSLLFCLTRYPVLRTCHAITTRAGTVNNLVGGICYIC